MGQLTGARLTRHDLSRRVVTVEYDPSSAGVALIQRALDRAGYPSTVVS